MFVVASVSLTAPEDDIDECRIKDLRDAIDSENKLYFSNCDIEALLLDRTTGKTCLHVAIEESKPTIAILLLKKCNL